MCCIKRQVANKSCRNNNINANNNRFCQLGHSSTRLHSVQVFWGLQRIEKKPNVAIGYTASYTIDLLFDRARHQERIGPTNVDRYENIQYFYRMRI